MNSKINLIFFIVITLGILGINACCTKKKCAGADEIHEIHFYNFTANEVEYITIYSYPKNSNFTIPLDSAYMFATFTGDHYSAYGNNPLNTNLDYKIKLVNTGEFFTLSGFELEKKGCNSCFPKRPESDFYNILKGYSIDGQPKGGEQISIYK